MKPTQIFLRKKSSGNFEFVAKKEDATHIFNTIDELRQWCKNPRQDNGLWFGKLIKATYSRSQTYFSTFNFDEIEKFVKKHYNVK